MKRLRDWWRPKEPVERAGLIGAVLIGLGVVVYVLAPADVRESISAALDGFGRR